MRESDDYVVIAGGGLAGLTCAIHLLQSGVGVILIERTVYPHHKVCGEYISNEVLPYLSVLGIDPFKSGAVPINRLSFSSPKGEEISCRLPLGGFGLSRYVLDHLLYEKALELGCKMITDTVGSIVFKDDSFEIFTNASGAFKAGLVIGAYGKRAVPDQKLARPFIRQRSPWLAVKGHYSGNFPDGLVGLHNFDGGYCGVSKVENGVINICYLTDYENFKVYKNTNEFEHQVLYKNPLLRNVFEQSNALFDAPLTISQVSFDAKEAVYDHVLMIGDTAGVIHPLCGNGMAMAIHSAKVCAELCVEYLEGGLSRAELEHGYSKAWKLNFKGRMAAGRTLSAIVRKKWLFGALLKLLVKFPVVLPLIVKKTHGQPIR
ncbi:MAG TPA: NAD(P)/FAD-dependent oxidoreductase [Pedobacter sp.]|uniref:NAD(P)/FAD-dependent oxidoreductase n=1 Tax=Pedobacter sp. TaxID=1411316 RepID=UPI002C4B28D7|nr:NAD(P)/FAD-dependent oxidoreductase [Pedobacter sp.]HMI03958.1 NAD(P)/FAD-dependent oxidoreductase [Pedobacter sp.]